MHGGNRLNAIDGLMQNIFCGESVVIRDLHPHQHGNRLQIIFDAMVHFAHDGGVGDESRVLQRQRSLIG